MSLRWRADGRLMCAAKAKPEDGDTYIDDRLHYQLSVISRAILPDVDEAINGLWHWVHHQGDDGRPDGFLLAIPQRQALGLDSRPVLAEPGPPAGALMTTPTCPTCCTHDHRETPTMSRLTDDPSDPGLTRGADPAGPAVPQAEAYLVLSEDERDTDPVVGS